MPAAACATDGGVDELAVDAAAVAIAESADLGQLYLAVGRVESDVLPWPVQRIPLSCPFFEHGRLSGTGEVSSRCVGQVAK